MQNNLINSTAIVLYLITAALLAWRLFYHTDSNQHRLVTRSGVVALGIIAVLLHGTALYDVVFTIQGLNIGFYTALSLIAWLAAFTTLLAAIVNPVENLGIILFPFAALAILLEIIFPIQHTLLPAVAAELKLHIILSLLAYSLFCVAALHALLLATQDRHLRNRKPGGFIRALPPLQTMENLLFQMIGLGFVLHSLALITGIIYLENMFTQHLVHKTVLSIIAWCIFAILLWGRWRFGWRGITAIRWTLGGFFALLLAYLGSKWVIEILLGR